MASTCRSRVRTALKAHSDDLRKHCASSGIEGLGFSCQVRRSSDLSVQLKHAIWSLLEGNMKDMLSASSMGWDAKKKHAEVFHRFSRFVCIFRGSEGLPHKLAGFSMFRFEHEDGEALLYCYELQVNPTFRGVGIGRTLMNMITDIGTAYEMERIMLTVLKANEKAVRFYDKAGFSVDETSPSNFPRDESLPEPDYEILSKRLLDAEDFEDF